MKYIKIIFLLLICSSVFSQNFFFMDIPKVDGESNYDFANRTSLTKKPKAKNTEIISFSFLSSKAIYLSGTTIKKDFKSADFQPMEIKLKMDKSIVEWHERIFKGSTLPTLDLFMDKTGELRNEILHFKLFNVKVKHISFENSGSFPIYKLTLHYEKIISAVTIQSKSGQLTGVNQTCFDIKNGLPCTDTL